MPKLETSRTPNRSMLRKLVSSLLPAFALGFDLTLVASADDLAASATIALWVIRGTTTLGTLILLLQLNGASADDRRQILPLLPWMLLLAILGWSLEEPIWIWTLFALKMLIVFAWAWARIEGSVEVLLKSRILIARRPRGQNLRVSSHRALEASTPA